MIPNRPSFESWSAQVCTRIHLTEKALYALNIYLRTHTPLSLGLTDKTLERYSVLLQEDQKKNILIHDIEARISDLFLPIENSEGFL